MTPTPPLPGLDPAPLRLAAACELLTLAAQGGWERCAGPGAPILVADRRQVVCPAHARQLAGLAAAGLLDRLRWATPPSATTEGS